MKTTLIFECDDSNACDGEKMRRIGKADDMVYVLWNLCNEKEIPEETRKIVQDWCNDNSIHFEEIYT